MPSATNQGGSGGCGVPSARYCGPDGDGREDAPPWVLCCVASEVAITTTQHSVNTKTTRVRFIGICLLFVECAGEFCTATLTKICSKSRLPCIYSFFGNWPREVTLEGGRDSDQSDVG